MIETESAEKAADYLRDTAKAVGAFTKQAKEKASMVKHIEGLLIKAQDNGKTPVSVRQAYARAEERFKEALLEDAIAAGDLAQLEAERDAAKIRISLYQTQVRDRM